MKKIDYRSASLLILSPLLCLLFLELGARAFSAYFLKTAKVEVASFIYHDNGGGQMPDPYLNHKWIPNYKYIDRSNPKGFLHVVNEQGFLEEKPTPIFPGENQIRGFYVGDSTTHSFVDPGKKFIDLVEKKVEENRKEGEKRHLDLINTGTNSYNTLIYYVFISRVLLKYKPHFIVLNYNIADPNDDLYYFKLTQFDEQGMPVAVCLRAKGIESDFD